MCTCAPPPPPAPALEMGNGRFLFVCFFPARRDVRHRWRLCRSRPLAMQTLGCVTNFGSRTWMLMQARLPMVPIMVPEFLNKFCTVPEPLEFGSCSPTCMVQLRHTHRISCWKPRLPIQHIPGPGQNSNFMGVCNPRLWLVDFPFFMGSLGVQVVGVFSSLYIDIYIYI